MDISLADRDSVMALAHLVDRDDEAPIVRFLVLRELHAVASTWQTFLMRSLWNGSDNDENGPRSHLRPTPARTGWE